MQIWSSESIQYVIQANHPSSQKTTAVVLSINTSDIISIEQGHQFSLSYLLMRIYGSIVSEDILDLHVPVFYQ